MKTSLFPHLGYGIISLFTDNPSRYGQLSRHMAKSADKWHFRFDVCPASGLSALEGMVAARRINLGNMGRYAILSMPLPPDAPVATCATFFSNLLDIADFGHGDVALPCDFLTEATDGMFEQIKPPAPACMAACDKVDDAFMIASPTTVEAEEEENFENLLAEATAEQRHILKAISALVREYVTRFHSMPPAALIEQCASGKVAIAADSEQTLSRIIVNSDIRIFLPGFNEVEIPLTPLHKAVYLLFLRHPEGILLKDISDHAGELEEIYAIVMPNRNERMSHKCISDMTDILSGSLIQKISNIKRIVSKIIANPDVASRYYIVGSRGSLYRIGLPADMISLPRILQP